MEPRGRLNRPARLIICSGFLVEHPEERSWTYCNKRLNKTLSNFHLSLITAPEADLQLKCKGLKSLQISGKSVIAFELDCVRPESPKPTILHAPS